MSEYDIVQDTELGEYGHYVETEEDLIKLEKQSNKKDDDYEYQKTKKMFEEIIDNSFYLKTKTIEKKIMYAQVVFIFAISLLCFSLYIQNQTSSKRKV